MLFSHIIYDKWEKMNSTFEIALNTLLYVLNQCLSLTGF